MLIDLILLAALLKTGLAYCWPCLRRSLRSVAMRTMDSTHSEETSEASSVAQIFGASVQAMPSDFFELDSAEFARVDGR